VSVLRESTELPTARDEASHLLVRAGEYVCALPLASVRRVVRALTVHPLPGATDWAWPSSAASRCRC
jgi:chemotaxis signal transduction protein